MPYPDTEYEYFEHRGNIARPMMAPPGGGGPGPGAGAPLLGGPVKYNEEVKLCSLSIMCSCQLDLKVRGIRRLQR